MPEERKLVSILFADVAGSTALGDRMDPEDMRALMSRYYSHARRIMPTFGGTLEKFIGDAVMAVFGLEQSHGDDAERALAAALALREAVATDTLLSQLFQLRIGVNTGEVVATGDGSASDFLVTGDAVNVAARLQQGALPGEIVAGERTARLAQGAFLFEEERDLAAKGKAEPLAAFPLRGPRSERRVEHPTFVGRRQDLMQLELLSERTLEERRPQMITIVAPAGAGKSRLLEEFLSHRDPAEFQTAYSRCLPYGQTLTYWPLHGLLRELLGGGHSASAGSDAELEPEPVRAVFRAAGYREDDAVRLAELILTTLGTEERGEAIDRESIFAAWRLFIEALSGQSPRVIVFEDLHWASDSLLDLVEHVTHLRTSAALLLITLSRPELLDRRPSWGGGRQNFTFLSLAPLPDRQTSELIDRQGYPVPAEVRELIVARSGGNPFFALELLHAFAERGGGAALPDSVQAAVQARMDQLSREQRRVLQAAAVAGRSFSATELAAIMDGTETQAQIGEALDELLTHDLITQVEHDRYDFRHILIRDVAYGTLSRGERIRMHSNMAVWLQASRSGEQPADQYIELIAYHYREALQLSRQSAVPVELPFALEHVIPIFARAGVLAGRTGAYGQARSQLKLAIELATPVQRVALYEQLGDSMLPGDVQRRAYQDALAAWRALPDSSGSAGTGEPSLHDPLQGARLMRKLLNASARDARLLTLTQEEAEALRGQALLLSDGRASTEIGDEAERWRLRLTACFDPRFRDAGRMRLMEAMQECKELAREATEYFERSGDRESLSVALDGYFLMLLYTNAVEQALTVAQRRCAIPDLSPPEWLSAVPTLANILYILGRFDECAAFCRGIFAELKPGQPIAGLGPLVAVYARSTFTIGAWDELDGALAQLDQIRELVLEYDESAALGLADGYVAALQVAVARQDTPRVDALAAIVRRDAAGLEPALSLYLDDLVDDTVLHLTSGWRDDLLINDMLVTGILCLCNEHGQRVPDVTLLTMVREAAKEYSVYEHLVDIGEALAEDDNDHLARAVDAAEAAHFVVHAARLRLILAERTGDDHHLERARSVLERLQDRQSLQKLRELERARTSQD